MRGSWREPETGQEWGGRDHWYMKYPLPAAARTHHGALATRCTNGAAVTPAAWCPCGGGSPARNVHSSCPPAWFHLALLKHVLDTRNDTVQRSNYSPNSVLILTPHTTVTHILYCNGPSARHALHQQKLLPEEENLCHFLVMNTPSHVFQR